MTDDLRLDVRHTAQLEPALLQHLRRLLDDVYDGDFSDDDWDHALGGLHVLAWSAAELVGHAALVQRQLVQGERPLRAGYVEAMAVLEAQQRRGIGTRLMLELERVIAAAYDLGALSASEEGVALYVRRGWLPWRGPTAVILPTGTERTPDEDGGIYVFSHARGPRLDLDAELACDYRRGDVW
ncbi:MAG: GNAT family N-acetyltransferase [Polyangiales bacterium]